MPNNEQIATRKRAVAKRIPRRALEAARALEGEPRPSGVIWRRMTAMRSSELWADHPSFLFSGPKGVGKTTALAAVGAREIMHGRNVWYLSLTRLPRIIKAHQDSKPQMADLEECGLLLLDELHRFGDLPAWVRAEAVALIDHRYGTMKQTGAAGTLGERALSGVIGPEVIERFQILIESNESRYR